MNKTELMNSITRKIYKTKISLEKHSPEILLITGVVGVVASSVLLCKATIKATETIDEARSSLDKINDAHDKGSTTIGKKYTEDDYKNDMKITYAQTGVKLAKLYAIPVGIGTISIAAILGSHNIIHKRNVALATSYTALFNDYKGYRSRVVAKFGEELDRQLKYNLTDKEIEETTTDENGNEVTNKKVIQVMNDPVDPSVYSPFARFFDDSCAGWDPNPQYSLMFLRQQQDWANEVLKTRGYLTINEVYEMLGIPKCGGVGQIHGWVYDEKNPIGDNYVDFGIYTIHIEKNRDFVNGYEPFILLDFNHDGDISQYIM